MKIIKYFFEFIFIITFFFLKSSVIKKAIFLGDIIGRKIGPYFRSNSKIQKNLEISEIGNSINERQTIINNMGKLWKNSC